VAGCATPIGFAGHAGETANLKLTFHLDHSAGANDHYCKMTRTELIIQLLKVAIGLAFGAYFVWWSLQVLDRLTAEYDARTAVVARAS